MPRTEPMKASAMSRLQALAMEMDTTDQLEEAFRLLRSRWRDLSQQRGASIMAQLHLGMTVSWTVKKRWPPRRTGTIDALNKSRAVVKETTAGHEGIVWRIPPQLLRVEAR
jgi:hypothetical protein